jgi:carboxyl-terminal processing protease
MTLQIVEDSAKDDRMNNHYPRHLTVFLTVLMLFAAFLIGYQARDGGSRLATPVWASLASNAGRSTLDDVISLRPVQLFNEAFEQVQAQYVDPVTDPSKLAYAAIRGMLAELDDPYTRFMDPKEFKEFRSDNAGRFAGIGATLNMVEIPAIDTHEGDGTIAPITCPVCGTTIDDSKHYRVNIVDTLPNSPARAANLQAGDLILKVGEKPTDGLTVSEVADQIRGPEGTKVTLTIARKGIEKPLEVTLTRAQIEVPAVEVKMLENNTIGYLRLYQFNEKTVAETSAALEDLNKKNVRGIVLDLRSNPGGLLSECIKVASLVLPSDNKVIVSTKGRGGHKDTYTRIHRQIYAGPLVVLVNKGSASASEILAGAIKDYKRGTVIGETTFGKALVQTVIPLGDPRSQSAMAVTTAHYYTPSGYDLAKKGIQPDQTVELGKDFTSISEKDNQAMAALKALKEEIAKAGAR